MYSGKTVTIKHSKLWNWLRWQNFHVSKYNSVSWKSLTRFKLTTLLFYFIVVPCIL